jgi:hypothetical protein
MVNVAHVSMGVFEWLVVMRVSVGNVDRYITDVRMLMMRIVHMGVVMFETLVTVTMAVTFAHHERDTSCHGDSGDELRPA